MPGEAVDVSVRCQLPEDHLGDVRILVVAQRLP